MENKNYIYSSNLSRLTNNSNISKKPSTISLVTSTPLNSTLSSSNQTRFNKVYSDHKVLTQPIINKLSSEILNQKEYAIKSQLLPQTVTTIQLNPSENTRNLSIISMANTTGHLMSALNPTHLSATTGSYFVSGLNELASNYKINPSSSTDLPSPSSSSNSSNHHQNHQTKRQGDGNDPTRKRALRLQKNREAARECRRKKKQYIKCLEERVSSLETQNRALIEELRQLKELYCQQEETNNKTNSQASSSSATSSSAVSTSKTSTGR